MVERNKRNRDFAETRTPVGVIGGLVGLVAASTAVAALVVAAATPAIAMVGLAASGTIGMFDNLPGYLEIDELSEKSNIYATGKDGKPVLLASFYDQNRVEVAWSQIDQDVKDATIASEDPRFYDHGGVDIQGTLRAAVTTASGRETQGGSSLAQQYVKNVRVQECELNLDEAVQDDCYDAVTETTIDRKIKEMRLAIGIEKRYSKDEILLGYLNIAGFGGTVYGIEAAANYYFSASASNLTLAQAASLVAIVNNPVKFQLDKPNSETNGAANGYAQNLGRRNYILGRMLALGKVTRAQYDEAVATPVEPKITEPSTGCHTAGASAYFCDYVKNILQTDPIFGEDAETRMLNFRRGGYDVYTSLDMDLQAAADRAIARERADDLPRLGRRGSDLERAGRHRAGARDGAEQGLQPRPAGAAEGSAVHEHQLQHRLRAGRVERIPAGIDVQGVHARAMAERRPLAQRARRLGGEVELGHLPRQLPGRLEHQRRGLEPQERCERVRWQLLGAGSRRSGRSTPDSSAWRRSSTSAASERPRKRSGCTVRTATRSSRARRP